MDTKKNIFICHRPYHILRCCDIIKRSYENGYYNILVSFDVKLVGRQQYQRFKSNEVFFPLFEEVFEMGRSQVPTLKQPLKFIRYCKSKRLEYEELVNKHKDAKNIYFFSDDEIDVEILVDMLNSVGDRRKQCVIVDEGVATYSNKHKASFKVRVYSEVLSKLAGFREFNSNFTYGGSNLYNFSLANDPERAVFRYPIEKMPSLSEELCVQLRNCIKEVNAGHGNTPYFLYVSTYLVPLEKEISTMKMLRDILNKNGVDCYIKLHPLQNEVQYEELKEHLLDKGYPIELFYSKNAIIGGGISSALYNAYLQGYHVINMSPLLNQKEDNISVYRDIPKVENWENFENYILNTLKM